MIKTAVLIACLFPLRAEPPQEKPVKPAKPVKIAAQAGKEFTVELVSNPTTGYSWRLAKPLDEKILKFVGKEYFGKKTKLVGAGGREVWTFRALAKGKAKIELEYVRDWEKKPVPADTAGFKVIIK